MLYNKQVKNNSVQELHLEGFVLTRISTHFMLLVYITLEQKVNLLQNNLVFAWMILCYSKFKNKRNEVENVFH